MKVMLRVRYCSVLMAVMLGHPLMSLATRARERGQRTAQGTASRYIVENAHPCHPATSVLIAKR